jgi:membrane protease subunit HflK
MASNIPVLNSGDDRDDDRRKGDPWSSPDQGPPDLDEALNKMRDQLRGIFGGKRGGSGGGSGKSGAPQLSAGLVGLLIAVLLVVWLFAGVYQVDEKERAVILRLGKYHETLGPGLHWNPVIIDQRFTVLVTQEQDYSARGLMLTEDENIVEVPISVQYNIPDPRAFVLNVRDPITSLRHATDSALRHVVGSTKSSAVLSEGRQVMAQETKVRLQTYLDLYETGIAITTVNLLKAEPPTAVKSAFDAAKEDKERFVNEAQAYANGIVPEARGKSQRILQEAVGYRDRVIAEAMGNAERFELLYAEYRKAPEVTRERLYLDAMETVMSNSSKVLVDIEGGNNMMYLPLDKLVSQSAASSRAASAEPDLAGKIAREVLDQLRREQSRTTRSEGR